MIIVLIYESSDFIGDQETAATDMYHTVGRAGVVENAFGKDSCENLIRCGGMHFIVIVNIICIWLRGQTLGGTLLREQIDMYCLLMCHLL